MGKRLIGLLATISICALLSACEGETYPVVDSGQTACYDVNITAGETGEIDCPDPGEALYGQGAQFSNNPINLVDNGDGTVSDNVTDLMWQQTPPTGVYDGDGNGYFYYSQAVTYCDDLELSGYDDWRVPTLKELYSISDFGSGWPYIDTDYFDLANRNEVDKSEQYWGQLYIGHTEEGGYNAALGVNHVTGHIKAYPSGDGDYSDMSTEKKSDGDDSMMAPSEDSEGEIPAPPAGPMSMGKRIRCVRGGDGQYGINNFVDNSDGTISDDATGLMWQKFDNDGQTMNWEDALTFAEAATTAGYRDWRLPSVKELQSIVDYTKSPTAADDENAGPAIDTDYFVLTPINSDETTTDDLYFYENGTAREDYGYYWTSTSAYFGPMNPEYYFAWYVAFGTAVDGAGNDYHGAGGVRFDTKQEYNSETNITAGDPERVYNYVLLVRDIDNNGPPNGSSSSNNDGWCINFLLILLFSLCI